MTGYDPLIFATYERFLLHQYKIETEGLYFSANEYLIYCPQTKLTTPSIDGQGTIHEWLDNFRMLGQWIHIVNELPEGAVRIDENINKNKPSGTGYLITQPDINYEIDLLIPKIFPDYEIVSHNPTIVINFLEPITEDGKKELKNIFKDNNFPFPVAFVDTPNSAPRKPIESLHETTITYRRAKKLLSSNLCSALEKDEDDWVTNRNNIIDKGSKANLLPVSLQAKTSRGLIDASFANPDNLRNYLSLFEQVIIIPPYKEKTEVFLKSLGATREELLTLIEMGKVQLLLPKSTEKYESKLIEEGLERKAANIPFTRNITSFTLQEIRKRNPLFLPPITTLEKQTLLRAVDESLSFLNDADMALARKIIAETGIGWISMPNVMNEADVSSISQFGIVNAIDAIFQHHYKKNIRMPLIMASPIVELAAATGSVLIPPAEPKLDLSPFCQVIAEFYSGIPNNDIVVPKPDYANFAVEQILTISQHIPIVEFATTFNGAEINRFRNEVLNIANNSASPDELEAAIEAFNHFVKQYEKDKNSLSAWNIKGFILGQIGKASGLPLGAWMVKTLTNTLLKGGNKLERVSAILDSIEAQIIGTYPSSILVSRMRDKIKKKI